MATVLDATGDCSPIKQCLKQSGYDTVVRYYSRSEWKTLSQREAIALGGGGIRLAVVYQNRQNQLADFTSTAGEAAGRSAATTTPATSYFTRRVPRSTSPLTSMPARWK